jgi:hypothetical protein
MEFNLNSLNLDNSATKDVKYRQADNTGLIYVYKKLELKHWSLRRVQVDCTESAKSLARQRLPYFIAHSRPPAWRETLCHDDCINISRR